MEPMNHRYAVIFLGLLPFCSSAQITLTRADNAPEYGSSFTIHRSMTYAQPGPAGEGQNWDHSMLTSGSTHTIHVENSTGVAGTHLLRDDNDSLYFQVNDQGMYLVREITTMAAPGLGATDVTVNHTGDGVRKLAFPAALAASWNGPVLANYAIEADPFTRSGNYTAMVDAQGSIQLPSITHENVLRVHLNMETTETGSLGGFSVTANRRYQTWSWYAEWLKHPLLKIVSDTMQVTSPFPSELGNVRTEWLDETSVGIIEAMENNASFGVWPTPAIHNLNVTLPVEGKGAARANLVDMQGRMVREWSISAAGNTSLDIAGLASGQYTLQVIANGRAIGARKVIIE
jgi:hypothetical protein